MAGSAARRHHWATGSTRAASAFLWGGLPAEILTAAREQRLTLFTSAPLIAELEDVLARNKFAQRIARVGSTVAALIAGYRALVTLVRTTAAAPVSRDPDDDQVLACALAANAHLIVTRDRDLRTLDPFHSIRILSAREALALIAEQKGWLVAQYHGRKRCYLFWQVTLFGESGKGT